MTMSRGDKEAEVEFLTDAFKRAQSSIYFDYQGLNAADQTELRRELRKAGIVGRVTKNTYVKLSVKQALTDLTPADQEKLAQMFEGPTFLVFGFEDPVTPAKVIAKFAKEKQDKVKIKGGYADGTVVDAKGVEQLSNMPGRDEVLAMLLRVISAPAQQMVNVLAAPGRNVVTVVDACKRKLEA